MTSGDFASLAPTGASAAWNQRFGRLVSTDRLVWLGLALLWILTHSFVGIQNDARIYMGRALADLDPAGVGQDMMFQLDGQSAFTLFRFGARALVGGLGLESAVAVFTLASLVAWFVAICVLVRTLVPGRAALLVLVVAIVLPRFYAPWHLFQAGESEAIPRPLAEAGVLLAMAAVLRGRTVLSLGGVVAAALIHPIMAAPGFAVCLAMLIRRDRRWLAVAALGITAILVAAALGVPFVSRLLSTMEPAWRAITVERCPCLWVGLWPANLYGRLVVEAITIVIAGSFLDRMPRFFLVAALLTGLLGCLASFMLADQLLSVLALQVQLWRALWLPAVLAPVAAGICVWRLPSRGRPGLVALALLAVAWTALDWLPLGPLAAAAALGCLRYDSHRSLVLGQRFVFGVAVVCGLMIVIVETVPLLALVEIMAAKPAGTAITSSLISSSGVIIPPVVLMACLWWRWRDTAAAPIGAALAVVSLACLVALGWDSRTPSQATGSNGPQVAALRAMLAQRPGEVLWIGTDYTWAWLGRAAWAGQAQGAAVVFSRDLAFKWHERALALIAHGFADGKLLSPWRHDFPLPTDDLAKADLVGLCRRPDAPAWIIAPIETGRKAPDVSGLRVWSPGFVDQVLTTTSSGFQWTSNDRYGVVPCARS